MRLLLIAVLVCAGAGVAAEEPRASDATVRAIEFRPSKYEGHPRYEELRASAPRLRAQAIVALRERLGIAYEDRGTVKLRFQDLAPWGVAVKEPRMAERITETVEGADAAVVVIYWEHLIAGVADAQEEITHEFFHAVHRERQPREAYVAVPRWVREGLALHAAGQGPGRIRYLLQDRIEPGPDSLVQGLEEGQHDLDDYAEDWLAFLYIEEEHGSEAVRAIAEDVVTGGVGYRAAIAARTGEDWPTFKDNARRHARTKLRLLEKNLRIPYGECFARFAAGDTDATAAALDVFLAAHAGSYCEGLARYRRAKCDWLRGRWAEAEAGFRQVVERHPRDTGLVDEARLYVARCRIERGDWDGGWQELHAFLRDFPGSEAWAEGREWAVKCLRKLGREAEAEGLGGGG